jgi:UDP-2,3-diacylglucosamine pyrophosphatase LpxH
MGGKKFFFAHGDLVNRADYLYRGLRLFFRSPFIRFLVWAFPGHWVDAIGGWSSKTSRAAKPEIPRALPVDKMASLRKVYRNYAAERLAEGFDFVVMGHCHDLDEMCFQIGGRSGQYVNVGYPRVHGSYLSWSPGEDKIQRERMPQI